MFFWHRCCTAETSASLGFSVCICSVSLSHSETIDCASCVQDSCYLCALNSELVGVQDCTFLRDRCRTVLTLKSDVCSQKVWLPLRQSVEFELYYIHILPVTQKTRASVTRIFRKVKRFISITVSLKSGWCFPFYSLA